VKYGKKPKYKLDPKRFEVKDEKDLEGEDLFREIMREKRKRIGPR